MAHPVSGHVFRFEGKRRPVWRAKYRLPDGRQVKKTLGPDWTARGRPPTGYFTKRTAEAWLRKTLVEVAAGALPGMIRTGATVADACAEYLRYIEQDRQRKPSTLRDYDSIFRNHVIPHLGSICLEDLTPDRVERWAAHEIDPGRQMANRTREKTITVFHGAMERARKLYRLPSNLVADVDKPRTPAKTDIQVFSPEEVMALVRAADSEQDAAIYLTAAFTGLRQGELIALHWRDVDFAGSAVRVRASYTNGHLTSPKSGKVRSVPMAPKVAETLARLSHRGFWTGDDDLAFVSVTGSYLDGSALSKRYRAALQRAALRPLRFHDLRHTFGTRVISVADIRRVQEWMGTPTSRRPCSTCTTSHVLRTLLSSVKPSPRGSTRGVGQRCAVSTRMARVACCDAPPGRRPVAAPPSGALRHDPRVGPRVRGDGAFIALGPRGGGRPLGGTVWPLMLARRQIHQAAGDAKGAGDLLNEKAGNDDRVA